MRFLTAPDLRVMLEYYRRHPELEFDGLGDWFLREGYTSSNEDDLADILPGIFPDPEDQDAIWNELDYALDLYEPKEED